MTGIGRMEYGFRGCDHYLRRLGDRIPMLRANRDNSLYLFGSALFRTTADEAKA